MRDEAAVRCDFIWRRDGAQIAGVLEGKTEQRRKYGPGTCTYISDSGAEFYADAEWVLTPEELWLYDINTIRGVQFIGRKDRTHIRLYRARPYQCTVTNGETMPVVANAHDRGFSGSVLLADGSSAEWQLLRAWYPSADARGIADQTRLTLNHASSAKNLAAKTAPAKTSRISIDSGGLTVDCQLQAEFDM
jgi:hypothetical protein